MPTSFYLQGSVDLTGPAGPTGPEGPQGPMGPVGPQGVPGVLGVLPTFADNTEAIAGDLVIGEFYATATGEVRVVV